MRICIALILFLLSPGVLADAKAGEKKAQLCLLCHKVENVMAFVPLLEGQPRKYLVSSILAYKTGKRSDPVMQTNVASLSQRDVNDIADYFASRPAVTGAFPTDAAKVAAGEARARQLKCAACHGDGFQGRDDVPRLAGQRPKYLAWQLEGFAQGRRAHPPIEVPFGQVGDPEAIAHFLASLK